MSKNRKLIDYPLLENSVLLLVGYEKIIQLPFTRILISSVLFHIQMCSTSNCAIFHLANIFCGSSADK